MPPLPSPQLAHYRILLASNSPRRRELLAMILPKYDIAPARDVDESYPSGMEPSKVPEYISRVKAHAYADMLVPGEIIITADTVVINGSDILGKPHSEADAFAMLRHLSGHTHTVVTGVTLSSTSQTNSFSESTRVSFGELTDDEIEQYVRLYRPMDKAGAYGIQEWIGAIAIKGIDGCFYNVMGLPLHSLYAHLRSFTTHC